LRRIGAMLLHQQIGRAPEIGLGNHSEAPPPPFDQAG
jgi:hypothetical protein